MEITAVKAKSKIVAAQFHAW